MTASQNTQGIDHKFKIGLFGANCSGGLAATTVAERWHPTWRKTRDLAQMADRAGLDFMLPLGRWAGYGGLTDHNGHSFETMIWAAGILAVTERIKAFSTLHVAFVNPVYAAKQMVTADHIGDGRFGLNIVCGWNEEEFAMLGIELGDHHRRYDQGQEWLDVVKKVWTEEERFDFDGEFFQLKQVRAQPKPLSEPWPLIINAGQSGAGLAFAVRNGDYLFRAIQLLETAAAEIAQVKADSRAIGRDVGVFTNCYCVCRPTSREADEFHHYYAVENSDDDAVERMYAGRGIRDHPDLSDQVKAAIRLRMAAGNSAYPLIGDADQIAAQISALGERGFSGAAIGLVNYLDELPYFRDHVLPRLERLGLRQPGARKRSLLMTDDTATQPLGWRAKIGVITPTENTVTEPEFNALRPAGVTVHFTRMPIHFHPETDNYRSLLDDLELRLTDLKGCGVDAVAYNCTVGSMACPADLLIDHLRNVAGVPAVATASAITDALKMLGVEKIALATPYSDATNAHESAYFQTQGIEVVAMAGLNFSATGTALGRCFGAVPPADILDHARAVDHPEAQAILISCANFASASIAGALEAELGKPVITSNIVAFHAGLRAAGIEDRIEGYGQLLAAH